MKLFVARQPIVDFRRAPYAYEFLHRSSEDNCYRADLDGSTATRTLLASLSSEFDLSRLTGGGYAFINFTEELLFSKVVEMVDPHKIVIEILETVRPTEAMLERLTALRAKGYRFALDDYVGEDNLLLEVAEYIKVDFLLTTPERQAEIARNNPNKVLLAEKIETEAEYQYARKCGYQLFQGYYFSQPIVLSKTAREIATPTYLQLWKEINKNDPSFNTLDDIIHKDVNLTYKVLTRFNSIMFYRGNKVTNLHQALVSIGFAELKRWVLLLLLRRCYSNEDTIVAKQALTRAVFAEKLTLLLGWEDLAEDAYTMGLFSLIDMIMGDNMEKLLGELAINPRVRDCLLGQPGQLRELLDLVQAYGDFEWEAVNSFITKYDIDPQQLYMLYFQAVDYAELAFFDG